jgi:hypothetical protein
MIASQLAMNLKGLEEIGDLTQRYEPELERIEQLGGQLTRGALSFALDQYQRHPTTRQLIYVASLGAKALKDSLGSHIDSVLLEGRVIRGNAYKKRGYDILGKWESPKGKRSINYSSDVDLLVVQSPNSNMNEREFENAILDHPEIQAMNPLFGSKETRLALVDVNAIPKGYTGTQSWYCYLCSLADTSDFTVRGGFVDGSLPHKYDTSMQQAVVIHGKQPPIYNGLDKFVVAKTLNEMIGNGLDIEIERLDDTLSPLVKYIIIEQKCGKIKRTNPNLKGLEIQ